MLSRILLIGLVFLCVQTHAQTVDQPADTAKPKKKTVKVTVIDPKGKKRIDYSGQPILLDSVQKAVKVDPVLLVRGEFTVFYEWRLSRHFSVEGGAGLTYIDFAYEIFENEGRFVGGNDDANDVQFHTGIALRAGARYFPSRFESAITGFYIAPVYAYRSWNMEYFIDNGFVSMPHEVKREWHEIRFQFGEQDPDPYSVLFSEWYINFGIQFRENDHVQGGGITAEIVHDSQTRLVLGAGVKIGFVL